MCLLNLPTFFRLRSLPSLQRKGIFAVAAVLGAMLVTARVPAQSVFDVQLTATANGTTDADHAGGNAPVTRTFPTSRPSGTTVTLYGEAGRGILRARAVAQPLGSNPNVHATVEAKETLTDLVFTGAGSSTMGTLNLDFNGTITASGGIADYVTDLNLLVATDTGVVGTGKATFTRYNGSTSSGALSGLMLDAVNHLAIPVSVPLGTPVALTMIFTLDLYASNPGEMVDADFARSLIFARSGPVFTLPVGVTVNSADGNIVNNRFVPAAAVPEPGAVTFLIELAVGGTGLRHARKRRSVMSAGEAARQHE